ncbi:Vesicle transport protein [Nymphaea thermarum]|nr:Vesicle transport protein [Nymphaea thermarum]
MERVNEAMSRVKTLIGMEVEDPEAQEANASLIEDFNRNCTLSTKQRIYGFAVCFVAGVTCTLLSMIVFLNPIKFATMFTLGNLLALGSTAFLMGPKRQMRLMVDPVRVYATGVYIGSIIIALLCALYVRSKLLTLLAIILEFGSLVWYSLSYIPFARSMITKVLMACFDTEF